MKIIVARPPNYEAISKRFPAIIGNLTVVFCYGYTIYCQQSVNLSGDLIEHETIHCKQQGNNPSDWWDRYLTNGQFRLSQEVEAYRAQYKWIQANVNRAQRRMALRKISSDLASPIYGSLVTKPQAQILITDKS